MKILVNAINAKIGGIKSIVNSFLNNASDYREHDFYFMVHRAAIGQRFLNCKGSNIQIIASEYGDVNYFIRFFWYRYLLPRYIKEKKFDCMINLTNYGPGKMGCRQILLLHNSKHISRELQQRMSLPGKVILRLEDYVLKLSLKRSDKLVVQTEYMKEGIVKKFNFDKDKVAVIPSCSEDTAKTNLDGALERKLQEFIDMEENVLVNISFYSRHKNLELLLASARYIKEHKKLSFKLILTISETESRDAARLIDQIKAYGLEDRVMAVGNIPHEYVHQLLDKAKVFVFPSYAESFGIPMVEAMKHGLPVIAADLGFARDVCGDAALYFKYDNEEDLAAAIIRVLTDRSLYRNLKDESIRRGSLYNETDIFKKYIDLIT